MRKRTHVLFKYREYHVFFEYHIIYQLCYEVPQWYQTACPVMRQWRGVYACVGAAQIWGGYD